MKLDLSLVKKNPLFSIEIIFSMQVTQISPQYFYSPDLCSQVRLLEDPSNSSVSRSCYFFLCPHYPSYLPSLWSAPTGANPFDVPTSSGARQAVGLGDSRASLAKSTYSKPVTVHITHKLLVLSSVQTTRVTRVLVTLPSLKINLDGSRLRGCLARRPRWPPRFREPPKPVVCLASFVVRTSKRCSPIKRMASN